MSISKHEDSDGTGYCRGCGTTINEEHLPDCDLEERAMEIKLKLKPFQVPNFVVTEQAPGKREDGWKEFPGFPLSAVDADTLGEMCDEFRAAIFAKAGMADNKLSRHDP